MALDESGNLWLMGVGYYGEYGNGQYSTGYDDDQQGL